MLGWASALLQCRNTALTGARQTGAVTEMPEKLARLARKCGHVRYNSGHKVGGPGFVCLPGLLKLRYSKLDSSDQAACPTTEAQVACLFTACCNI